LKKLHVFHLIKGLGRGGAEVMLMESLRVADRRSFEFACGYFLPWKNALAADLSTEGTEPRCFGAANALQMLARTPAVARALRDFGADIVHCHLPLAGVVGRIAGKIAGIPIIYTEHNVMERYHPATRRINLLTWKMQKEVVAVSEGVAASVRLHAGDSVPVTVVPNGVSLEAFRRDPEAGRSARSRLGIPETAPVVGSVAVFRAQKRLDEWLKAAVLFRERFRNARFLLVGDGPLRGELEGEAKRLGIEEAVHFAGLQQDVRPWLSAMDAYMMSSSFEGLPVALLEAMAMEIPAVATAVGGVPEAVTDGVTGYLVEPGHPEELASRLEMLFSDKGLRGLMGSAGRQKVSKGFSVKGMERAIEEIYCRAAEGRGERGIDDC
jgi:glycosyltransferase involved in cell wall biosynthesis